MSATILVSDDDFDNRTILREALEAAGYRVVLATNGEEALEAAAREKPALIFLDLSMPKMSGWECAKRIRAMPEIAQVPVVAFTAHALQGDELKARAAGCDDYLSKPCAPREAVRMARAWLRRAEERSSHVENPGH